MFLNFCVRLIFLLKINAQYQIVLKEKIVDSESIILDSEKYSLP